MNELIVISKTKVNEQEINTINARELHNFLEINTRFNDWINNRINEYNFQENQDFITLTENLVSGGSRKEYHISLDMAKELSMVERNDKGKEARRYFIECESKLKELEIPQMNELEMIAKIALSMNAQNKKMIEHDNRLNKIEDQLSSKVDLLKTLPEIKEKTERMILNEYIRAVANKLAKSPEDIWLELYREFKYREHIDLAARARNKSLLRNKRISRIDMAEELKCVDKLYALAIKMYS